MTPANYILAVLSLTTLSASSFMGAVAPSGIHRLAFTPAAKPFQPTSATQTQRQMAFDTEVENKVYYEEHPATPATASNTPIDTTGMPDNITLMAQDRVAVEENTDELSETQQLMTRVKEAGTAGVVSYALWELAFWTISVPVCVAGYKSVTGHWPDLSSVEDQKQLGAEAFAFVNFARFAVPLRIGLALGTTPWIQENIIDKFAKKDGDEAKRITSDEQ